LKKNIKIIFTLLVITLLMGCDKKTPDQPNYNTIEYNGRIWMDRDLGAREACKSLEGNNACWGNLYQWGRPADGHEQRGSNIAKVGSRSCDTYSDNAFSVHTMNVDSYNNIKKIAKANWYSKCDNLQSLLWSSSGDGINEVCPEGWHVATMEDFESAKIKDGKDAFNKLKLTLGGVRHGLVIKSYTGRVEAEGLMGRYWTSTVAERGRIVSFDIDQVSFEKSDMRSIQGASVRCVKNQTSGK